jgi:DNA-binding XRE family transcriptional regulator
MDKINSRVAHYILENGKTQAGMAVDLGVSKQAVTHWCQGIRYPNKWLMPTVLAYLGRNQNRVLAEIEVFPDFNSKKPIDNKPTA